MEAVAAQMIRERTGGAASRAPAGISILVYNGHFPAFPCAAGHEFLNTAHLASLAGHVGLVSMIHDPRARTAEEALGERGVELFLWRAAGTRPPAGQSPGRQDGRIRAHAALAGLVRMLKAFPSRPRDTLTADLEFRNMSGALLQAIERRHWDALVVVQSSSARVVDYLPRMDASVLVMHDIRSRMFARRARIAPRGGERRRLLGEAQRYLDFERKYCRRYDLVVALSENDAAWIQRHYAPKRIAVVPIPLDAGYFSPAGGTPEEETTIVFTGLMDHPPNADAAVYFAREVFPRIRKEKPGARFLVVGRSPAEEVRSLSALPGVEVTGFVADTREYLARAGVVVVPLRFGSGVRNKILEAWAMEKCVVSTRVGAEGLEYEEGGNVLIADDADSMARAVLEALSAPDRRRVLGAAGRDAVLRHHLPQAAARTYYRHIRDTAAANAGGPMRLALDMRWLLPGVAGGLENQARSLLSELLSLDGYNRYTLIVPSMTRYSFDLRSHPNFRIVCRDGVRPLTGDLLWRAASLAHSVLRLDYWRSREVRQLEFLRSLDAEIVYSFPGYIHQEVNQLRQVLVVPDIQHEYLPEFFSGEALQERRRLYRESIRRADLICAVSEFTRQTLIERLGVPAGKVLAVPLAADPIFGPGPDPAGDGRVMRKYSLEKGYLFFPAHLWRHKNHQLVVAAMSILRSRSGFSTTLVCTGAAREGQAPLESQIARCGLAGSVRFLGYCPREDLPALYRNAGCLVFPSLFEGFGMPVLEAMASGCPVVCSNTTSLPEVAGDAALPVDPHDAEGLAEAIRTVLCDGDLRLALRERGLARARQFTWRRHALQTLAAIRKLHEQVRNSPSK